MAKLLKNIKKWVKNYFITIILVVIVCICIVLCIHFGVLSSSTAAAWVGDISVLIAILQLKRQHKDSVDQLEFEKQKQKAKPKVYVNYVWDDNYDEKYIECSLFNLGNEAGVYRFIGVYPSDIFNEVEGAIGKIENNRMVDQKAFVESLRGNSIQDFDSIACAEKLEPKAVLPTKINGLDYFLNGEMMVAVFQDVEDNLYYKEFFYDIKTDRLKRKGETKKMKIVD